MPSVSAAIQGQLCIPADYNVVTDDFVCTLPAGHQIGTVTPLFQKLESEQVENLRKLFGGGQLEDFLLKPKQKTVATVAEKGVKVLQEEVAKQGNYVKQLKAQKAEKKQIDAAASKLAQLQKQLCLAEGKNPAPQAPKGKVKK
uniref:Uncharacterized protein n=2 Tax=Sphaerodactylus townsendi TaxID=933632 RepID=A0ACB8ENB7_9SAUR